MGLGVQVCKIGFRAKGLGFRSLGFKDLGFRFLFRFQGIGFRIEDSGFGVEDSRLMRAFCYWV